eukprot:2988881-Amphidinium_carterae.1
MQFLFPNSILELQDAVEQTRKGGVKQGFKLGAGLGYTMMVLGEALECQSRQLNPERRMHLKGYPCQKDPKGRKIQQSWTQRLTCGLK